MNELIPEILPEDRPLSFWGHLDELRDRLLRSILAVFLGTAVTYALRFRLWNIAVRPLTAALSARPALGGSPFAYTDLAEPFTALMKLSVWAAVFVVSPYLFYQVWAFVRPALREREKNMATTFVGVTSACFVAGALFAYFFLFGALSDLLMDEAAKAGMRANLKPTEYLNLFLYVVVGAGVAFEAPVLFYFLARFGLVRSASMRKYWREATISILLIAGFCTPGDVLATMVVFGFILSALYFLSALVVWCVERARGDI